MTTDTEPNVFLAAGFTPSDLTPAQQQTRFDLMNSILALIRSNENVPIIEAITMLDVIGKLAWEEVQQRVAAAIAAAAAPTPAPVAPTPAPAPPVAVPEPSPEPVTPGPDWVDAAGQTYADWLASVTEAQQLAANLGTAYTPGPVPVFTAPGG